MINQLKRSGILTDAGKKNIEKIDLENKEKEAQLKRLKSETMRLTNRQKFLKTRIVAAAVDNPDLAQFSLFITERPQSEMLQPDLLFVI